jgi:HlyD family secretion protein
MKNILLILFVIAALVSCSKDNNKSDAFGNFEATEVLISAETSGKLMLFNINEGELLEKDSIVAMIDTSDLLLKLQQLEAQKKAISSKIGNVLAQIGVLNEQKSKALKDKERLSRLFKDKAATDKDVEDNDSRIAVLDKQIKTIEVQNPGILDEVKAMEAQIAQLALLIKKNTIRNPIRGTVLNKYSEQYEMVAAGKPLYKIADLSTMTLRVYVDGVQLTKIKAGQQVKVIFDKDAKTNQQLTGSISWISSKAEFTPKIIQTKDERVNLVYAVKVDVPNDGRLKIGMPGEVKFE